MLVVFLSGCLGFRVSFVSIIQVIG